MPWRRAHGKAAAHGASLAWESTPMDELPKPGRDAGALIVRDGGGRVRDSEAARRLASMRKAMPDFVRREIACAGDFKPFNRYRREWTRKRIAELHEATGGCSVAVAALVRAAGWGVAFGEYLATQGAESLDATTIEQSGKVLARASLESQKAYELAVREGSARRAQAPPTCLLDQIKASPLCETDEDGLDV